MGHEHCAPRLLTTHTSEGCIAHTAFTIRMTGLSGAGKTTIAHHLEPNLRARSCTVEILDGDVVGMHLSKGLGFSRADRDTNILRIAWVCALLTKHGVVAISAPLRRMRRRAIRRV